MGLCGEACPPLCRVCDAAELTTVFLGNEDEPDARFVYLVDCKHTIEVTGMDAYVRSLTSPSDDSDGSSSVAVRLPDCPRCKCAVRRSLRYNAVVNTVMRDIDAYKQVRLHYVPSPGLVSRDWRSNVLFAGYCRKCLEESVFMGVSLCVFTSGMNWIWRATSSSDLG